MTAIDSVVFSKLKGTTAINSAVDGKIFPEFRYDVDPSIAYDVTTNEVGQHYEGTDLVSYEVTISVVAKDKPTAESIATLVKNALDNASWTTTDYVVAGCFFDDHETSSVERTSKRDRLTVVDLRFELKAKSTS